MTRRRHRKRWISRPFLCQFAEATLSVEAAGLVWCLHDLVTPHIHTPPNSRSKLKYICLWSCVTKTGTRRAVCSAERSQTDLPFLHIDSAGRKLSLALSQNSVDIFWRKYEEIPDRNIRNIRFQNIPLYMMFLNNNCPWMQLKAFYVFAIVIAMWIFVYKKGQSFDDVSLLKFRIMQKRSCDIYSVRR